MHEPGFPVSTPQVSDTSLHDFASLLDNLPDMVYRYRFSPPAFEYVSRASVSLLGYAPEEYYADPSLWLKSVHPDDRPLLEGFIRAPDTVQNLPPLCMIRKDSQVIWVEHHHNLIRDELGEIVAVDGIAIDMTARRRAEQSLRIELAHTKNESQHLVQYAPTAIYEISIPNARFTNVNDVACQYLGFTREELLMMNPFDILADESKQVFQERMRRTLAGMPVDETVEYKVKAKDGRFFYAVLNSRIMYENDRPSYALVVAHDITERRLGEQLSQALNRINELIHSTMDFDEVMRRVAAEATEAVESESGVVLLREGNSWTVRYVHGLAEDIVGAHMNIAEEPHTVRAIETRRPVVANDVDDDDVINRAHFSQWQIRSVMVVPLIAGNQVIGLIFFNQHQSAFTFRQAHVDFAEKLAASLSLAVENIRLFRQEQAARTTAERASELRDKFIAIASHELRTPITTAMGYAQLLSQRMANKDTVTDDERRIANTIAYQAERLNRMIGMLLDVTRIDRGQLTLERTLFDLQRLVMRIADETRPTFRKHTLEVMAPADPVIIDGDELRLELVLQNLLQNAAKYSPRGGPVRLQLGVEKGMARVEVMDRGIGIPPQALKQLFTRFYRAPNAESRHISGLGLGLYVAQEIVRLHGGEIRVESQEGQGSTFIILLPRAPMGQSVRVSN